MPRASRITPQLRAWTLFGYWALLYLMTHLPGIDEWRPKGGWPIRDPDKIVHFCSYAGWICVWAWVLHGHGRLVNRTAMLYLLFGGAIYGAFDEITQGIVGRTPDIYDWYTDSLGLIAGLVFIHFWQRRAST